MQNPKSNWSKASVIGIALLAALLNASCGGTGTAMPKPSATSGLAFDKNNLNFGSVPVGGTKSASITVTNSTPTGGGAVTISRIAIAGAGFTLVTPTHGFSLTPGKSSVVTINFKPKVAGNPAGMLSIFIAGITNPAKISLAGQTIANNQLAVSPSALAFGTVTLGNSKSLSGSLSAGTSNVMVSSASWSGAGFSISGITFPLTIQAGATIPYTVTFTPEATGASGGGVAFVSDAPNSPATETFSGTGGSTPQSAQSQLDLLWDVSGPGVSGYKIYRGTQSGGPYALLTAAPQTGPSFTDSTVQAGVTYYYVATAIQAGVESPYSNELVAVAPTP